jgi:hypothetical protein
MVFERADLFKWMIWRFDGTKRKGKKCQTAGVSMFVASGLVLDQGGTPMSFKAPSTKTCRFKLSVFLGVSSNLTLESYRFSIDPRHP